MRMWMLPPKIMCSKHIAGEHGEFHKHLHNFTKKHSIKGRVTGEVQIEPLAMKARHDELSKYLKVHVSAYEMPDLSYLPVEHREAEVNLVESIQELFRRCPNCRFKMLDAVFGSKEGS